MAAQPSAPAGAASLAQTLLLISDRGFQWPGLRQAPPGPCISNPAVCFFETGFKGRRATVRTWQAKRSNGNKHVPRTDGSGARGHLRRLLLGLVRVSILAVAVVLLGIVLICHAIK
jgi:hypothetical protein